MLYRKFCKNENISAIGFGSWAIGGADWGKTDDEKSIKAIITAIENGVNFIDTADFYGFGHSEILIKRALDLIGKKNIFIATKFGTDFYNIKPQDGVRTKLNYTRDYLIFAAEQSLKRLGTDCIDLIQLHSPSIEYLENDEPWEALYQLKKDGKIKYAGLSVHSYQESEHVELVLKYKELISSLQIRYNMLERNGEKKLFQTAMDNDISIIARVPMLYGFMTGKYDINTRFADRDHRQKNLSPEKLIQYSAELEKYKPFFEEYQEYSRSQLAIAFTISNPAVTTAIPGGKTPEQVIENCKAANIDKNIFSRFYKI